MESLLTLIIAVGGIATGVGAIWAALVARRQAQISEQSLIEQGQFLREQSERARVSLEVDLMYKLDERLDSQRYRNFRRRSFMYVKENYFVDDDILEVQHLDTATVQLLDFFEELGYLVSIGVLPIERVWFTFNRSLITAWVLWEPGIKRLREERGDPGVYEEFENLYHRMVDSELRSTGRSEPPTKEDLRQFVEDHLRYVEDTERPATGEAGAKKE